MKRWLAAFLTLAFLAGSSLAEGDFPLILDNYGREITLTARPQRVVTAGPNCTELFIALGLEDLVIGKSCENHAQAPLAEYQSAYESIPELTFGYPTLEAVVGSGADFLYASIGSSAAIFLPKLWRNTASPSIAIPPRASKRSFPRFPIWARSSACRNKRNPSLIRKGSASRQCNPSSRGKRRARSSVMTAIPAAVSILPEARTSKPN